MKNAVLIIIGVLLSAWAGFEFYSSGDGGVLFGALLVWMFVGAGCAPDGYGGEIGW